MAARGRERRRAGRPAELDEPKTLAFRVDGQVAEAAEELAAKRGLTISEWLRELVATAIRQKERPTRNMRIGRTTK